MESIENNRQSNSPKGTSDMSQLNGSYSQQRRNLLRLGAAGMPMVITLRASAQSVLQSALDCLVTIPRRFTILVDSEGRAWAGEIRLRDNDQLTDRNVRRILRRADFEFPADTVPSQYRPDSCDAGSSSSDDDDDSGSSDDDDDDDDDDDVALECQYRLYHFSSETTFSPNNFISESGSWNLFGDAGLFTLLSAIYAQEYGGVGTFPGISCLFSILTALGQQ